MMPKVSVIMNCFNGERYLREAIDSVYAQTFGDWEIIFWDNASSDRTQEIANNYDSRLRYFRSATTIPLGAARRGAMKKATGEWVAFLDCDDYWFPNKLERQLKAVEGTEYLLCYAGIREIDPGGRTIREVLPSYPSGQMFAAQLNQFDINMVTPLVRRETLVKFRIEFDPGITASEEYNLFLRIAAKGPFCALPEVLGVWRISPGSLTDRQIACWADERFYTLRQLAAENPGIVERYADAFDEADARGHYYRARYLVQCARIVDARAEMRLIAGKSASYRLLWLSLFVPGLWQLLHEPFLKRKVLPRLSRLMR